MARLQVNLAELEPRSRPSKPMRPRALPRCRCLPASGGRSVTLTVIAWLMVSGMVNVAPGFTQTTNVINGCSDLILELYGPEVGSHARTAIGMA